MIIFLILGIGLGALSVLFVLQNITPVTVSLFAWHMDGSLAVILFLAVMSGVAMTLLILLPGLIRDEFRYSRMKKQAKTLEDELTKTKTEALSAAIVSDIQNE